MKNIKDLINKDLKVIIKSSGRKASNVGMYEDTGDLVFNEMGVDIPRGLPVDLFIVNPKSNNISEGDLFVLSEHYDEIYYCTNIEGESVSGGIINFIKNGYDMQRPIFTHFPIKNVRKVIGTSIQDSLFKLWNLTNEQINELIHLYNTNCNHKMFQY